MKIYIDCDDRYPDYSIEDSLAYGVSVEISQALYDRHVAALAEYNAVQAELRKLHNAACVAYPVMA